MKKIGNKAQGFFTKLRQIYGWLIATETKSEDSFTDNDNPGINWAGRPTSSKAVLQGRLVKKGFMLAFLFTVVILSGLIWYTWRSNRHLKMLETTHFRLLLLSGQIIHIDEVLTMSAHMAVETGEPEWEERYRNFEPQLDSAIKEVIELSPEQFMKDAISRTDTANIKLVAMENRAFDLIRQGQRDTASNILHSLEYEKQKQIYSSGIYEIADSICSLEEARLKKEQRIALAVIVLLIITMPLVAFIWFAALLILRRYIVDRKQAEDALHASEQRYRTLVENIPGIVYRCQLDEHWTMFYISEMIEKVSGYPSSDFIENQVRSFASIIHPEDRQAVTEATFKQVRKGQSFSLEYKIITFEGNIKWIFERGRGIRGENGKVLFLDGVLFDITEKKEAEEALKVSEGSYRSIFNSVNDAIFVHDIETARILQVNEKASEMFGYTKEQLLKLTVKDLSLDEHPYTIEEAMRLTRKTIEEGPQLFEWIVKHKNGYTFWVEVSLRAAVIEGQNRMLSILRDITQRKQAEDALLASEEKFRLMFETSPLGMVLCEMDGTFVHANRAYLDIIGYSHEEVMKLSYWDMTPRDYDADEAEQLRAMKETGRYGPYEKEYIRKTGQRVPVLLNGMVVKGANGVERIWSIVEDITNRKQAEQAILESEQRFRDFFEKAPIGFHIFGPDQIIIDINEAELEMIGYSREAIVGKKTWIELIVPQQRDMFKKHWHYLTTKGHVRNLEYTLVHKDGRHINVILNASVKFDKDGNVVSTRGSVLNVTARKQAEEARHKLTRELEAKNKELESILYVASHDLKSPLVNITGFGAELSNSCQELQTLLEHTDSGTNEKTKIEPLLKEHIPESLQFITAGTTKIQMLLDGLLQVSRVGTAVINIEPIDMNDLFAQLLKAAQFKVKEWGAAVDVDDALPGCRGDLAKTSQVFSNLVDNALKYLDPDRVGKIHVSGWTDGNMVTYCIEDNGIGIDPTHQKKIFEVFHRLNPDDSAGGEGLGLSIVMRILDRLNGSIRVESEPCKGSKFFVSLPTARA